ncbi:hypothetical protein [Pedobacter nyackensis]|uniref:hypothetical protein n=1 Tax=Pedobacter nyackensis TaxID=475255 RepID=UPI0029317C3B|nr:hypothetical protein [Pedobacter nyackensis]
MMNQEDIFRKVGQILNELQDQYEFLARNPNQLNELELELFLANANFLSDHVQIVKKINSHKPVKVIPEHTEDQSPVVLVTPVVAVEPMPEPEPVKEVELVKETNMSKEKTLEELEAEYAANELEFTEKEPAPVASVVEFDEKEEVQPEPFKFDFLLNDDPASDKFEFEEQSIERIFDRPLSREEEEIIAQKQKLRDSQMRSVETVEEVVVPDPIPRVQEVKPEPVKLVSEEPKEQIPQSPVSPAVVIDTPVEKITKEPEVIQGRPTLNDLLAGKSNFSNSVNEDNNKTSITDLKQAINLNEKLLYIKDLFNGYNLAYAEAIELVNKMPDFKTADNFLQSNYAVKNNWTAKQSTVDKFYELLNQRFRD